jgi:hypothetical protein
MGAPKDGYFCWTNSAPLAGSCGTSECAPGARKVTRGSLTRYVGATLMEPPVEGELPEPVTQTRAIPQVVDEGEAEREPRRHRVGIGGGLYLPPRLQVRPRAPDQRGVRDRERFGGAVRPSDRDRVGEVRDGRVEHRGRGQRGAVVDRPLAEVLPP